MKRSDEIMRMLEETKLTAAPVTEASNLYLDLGYDSLAFVCLLLEIEKTYSIQFELMEMGTCLRTDRLIALVEQKVKESEAAHDKTLIDESKATGTACCHGRRQRDSLY